VSRNARQPVVALGVGIVFGFGLAVSRMIDPQKVKDFLDFTAVSTGGWDPSLAVVMATALVVMAVFVRLAGQRQTPLVAAEYSFPPSAHARIDRKLVLGSAIFGVGWGLSGFCPAPAISDIAFSPLSAGTFVASMSIGYWLARWRGPLQRLLDRRGVAEPA
jgi:uncharacterized protein